MISIKVNKNLWKKTFKNHLKGDLHLEHITTLQFNKKDNSL